ncbi:hypothetical protein Godav_015070, partial [Gossypium davidsonii]|nr:hypothetical protein [Gossypium davidsonii]
MEENDRVREWGLHWGRFGKVMEGRSRMNLNGWEAMLFIGINAAM